MMINFLSVLQNLFLLVLFLSFVINILIYTIYLGGPLGAMGGMPRSLRPDVTVGDIRDPRMMQQGPRGIAPQRPAAPSAAGALSSLMVSNKYIYFRFLSMKLIVTWSMCASHYYTPRKHSLGG